MLVWLLLLPRLGCLQYDDYYDVVLRVSNGIGWSTDPGRWLAVTSNEHHVPLAVLLYFANWLVADGDNRSLAVAVLAILGVSITALGAMLPGSVRRCRLTATCAGLGFAAILAGPGAAAQVVKAFAGAMWLLADAFALVALWWVVRRRALWPALALGVGASLSYTTALVLWPALLLAAFAVGRRWRDRLLIAGAGVGACILYIATYARPVYHPALETRNPGALVDYLLRFLGSPLAADPGTATALGAALLVVGAVLAGFALGRGGALPAAVAPWLGVQLYVLGNGTMAAVARAGFGLDAALAARYIPLASLFVISLLAIALIVAVEAPRLRLRRALLAAVAAAGIAAVAAAWGRGGPILELLLDHAAQQPAAAWALREHVWDPALVTTAFCPWPKGALPAMLFLRSVGHVPFDQPPDPELGTIVEASSGPVDGVRGTLDLVTRHDPDWARVDGWAFAGGRPVREVVLVDGDGVIRGKAFVGFVRADVARLVDPGARRAGFVGYARVEPGTPLRAFARVEGLAGAVPLNLERVAP